MESKLLWNKLSLEGLLPSYYGSHNISGKILAIMKDEVIKQEVIKYILLPLATSPYFIPCMKRRRLKNYKNERNMKINRMKRWIYKWKSNGWKTSSGMPIINPSDVRLLLYAWRKWQSITHQCVFRDFHGRMELILRFPSDFILIMLWRMTMTTMNICKSMIFTLISTVAICDSLRESLVISK